MQLFRKFQMAPSISMQLQHMELAGNVICADTRGNLGGGLSLGSSPPGLGRPLT